VELTVPRLLVVTYLVLVLKDDYLFALGLTLRGGNHPGLVNSGCAYGYLIAIGNE